MDAVSKKVKYLAISILDNIHAKIFKHRPYKHCARIARSDWWGEFPCPYCDAYVSNSEQLAHVTINHMNDLDRF